MLFAMPALLLSLVLSAAADATPAANADEPAIEPAFECFRLNYAWGFSLAGSVVDRDGKIYRYHSRERERTPLAIRDGSGVFYAAADLRHKFEHPERGGSTDAATIDAKLALAAQAAAGALTTVATGTRDAGSSSCHAYLADAAGTRYRDVELGSDGGVADTRTSNDADAARELLDWLRSIGVAL